MSTRFGDYISGIGFRFYQPDKYPRGARHLTPWLARIGLPLDVLNTRLPATGGNDAALRKLCAIPRMSTYAIAAIINRGVADMEPDQCFVNVGVWHGFTLLAGMSGNPDKRCIGVDNFSQFGGPRAEFLERFERCRSARHEFHDEDYEQYFAERHREPIGFYLYDGEHSYENQLKGLKVAEPWFALGCRILIDDTNIKAARDALADFMAQSSHRYEVLMDKRTTRNLHPTLWNGVVVLQRVA